LSTLIFPVQSLNRTPDPALEFATMIPITQQEVAGTPILSASLPILDLALLEAADKKESLRLLDACHLHGFFYLDLRGSEQLLKDWEAMLAFAAEYFAQPLAEKMKDSRQSDVKGWVPFQSPFSNEHKETRTDRADL
jgi:isopenicillin N synthase-like dioxygenase